MPFQTCFPRIEKHIIKQCAFFCCSFLVVHPHAAHHRVWSTCCYPPTLGDKVDNCTVVTATVHVYNSARKWCCAVTIKISSVLFTPNRFGARAQAKPSLAPARPKPELQGLGNLESWKMEIGKFRIQRTPKINILKIKAGHATREVMSLFGERVLVGSCSLAGPLSMARLPTFWAEQIWILRICMFLIVWITHVSGIAMSPDFKIPRFPNAAASTGAGRSLSQSDTNPTPFSRHLRDHILQG